MNYEIIQKKWKILKSWFLQWPTIQSRVYFSVSKCLCSFWLVLISVLFLYTLTIYKKLLSLFQFFIVGLLINKLFISIIKFVVWKLYTCAVTLIPLPFHLLTTCLLPYFSKKIFSIMFIWFILWSMELNQGHLYNHRFGTLSLGTDGLSSGYKSEDNNSPYNRIYQ